MSIPTPTYMPRKLQLIDARDNPVRWVWEDEARQLLREKRVEPLWSKRSIRVLRLVDDEALCAGGGGGSGRQFSHNHETDTNPNGCWTLVRLRRCDRDLHEPWRSSLTEAA